jgi:hypothetical protein
MSDGEQTELISNLVLMGYISELIQRTRKKQWEPLREE